MSSINYKTIKLEKSECMVHRMSLDNINNLFEIINVKINEKFKNLNLKHKNLIKKYLLYACVICTYYFQINNPVEQFGMNNSQDIFSIFNMLFPYYELNQSAEIFSLDELFLNKKDKASELQSTYYVDHTELLNDSDYLEKYLSNSLKSLSNTFSKVSSKLLPNWLNIFPHTLQDYKSSLLYKNFLFKILYEPEGFKLDDDLIYTNGSSHKDFNYSSIGSYDYNFILGYNNLYGCIYNFLYNDIKVIKWMIFDKVYNKIVYPNIVLLGNELGINDITEYKWEQLEIEKQKSIIKNWNSMVRSGEYLDTIKSLIIFYLRYEYDLNKLNSLKLDKKCINLVKNKISIDSFDNDEKDEYNIYENNEDLDKCIQIIALQINFTNIYNYIYVCMQKFRYTWYGLKCLDLNHHILSLNNYLINCGIEESDKDLVSEKLKNDFKVIYITPKNIYNFFKSLLNKNFGSEYKLMSNSPSWDNLDFELKKIFIDRINFKKDSDDVQIINSIKKWFDITRNLKRVYGNNDIRDVHKKIILGFIDSSLFVDIIFETLVINGMLSYFKYNPALTNSKLMPDKNKNVDQFKKYMEKNIDIQSYSSSYNFLSNKQLLTTPEYFDLVKKSRWFNNFGGDWVAQLQMFHHIINQRLMMVTGATGAGKSTVAPFMILYGLKIINFDNNVKVICTQPRKQPTEQNADRIANSLGVPLIKDELSNYIQKNITYIQFQHSDRKVIDDEYHPYLRMVTDGTLINTIEESYMLKKPDLLNDNNFIKTNVLNCVLVDEAHEHNTNMDMILTLMRYATYINNQITLGIISATMDEDEPRYRKYYQMIDDNWKWPLNLNYLPDQPYIIKNYDRNMIDRRIHLSPPFLTTNFKIEDIVELPNKNYTQDELIVKKIKYILENSPAGDILVFQNGQAEIIKMVEKINNETPSNVLTIPFYSKLNNIILDNYVKKIGDKEVRKMINIKKNVPFDRLLELKPEDTVPEGTYSRFIIVATNIAEASITIDTLKFVIDNGQQKNDVYDPNRDISNMVVEPIANPNRKQRRGRVGRVAPGTVYYMYDLKKLREDILFKICTQNITTTVLDLFTNTFIKLIDENSDPNLADNIELIPSFLVLQYTYINSQGVLTLYSNAKKSNIFMIYPYSDGKYDDKTLIDEDGTFYIIHPNEDNFKRNLPTSLKIISRENYANKPSKVIELNKERGIIDSNNRKTPYGDLITNLDELFVTSDIKNITLILDALSLGISLDSMVFKNILLFIIFKNGSYKFKNEKLTGYSDLIIFSSLIPDAFFKKIDIANIIINLDPQLENLERLINQQIILNNFYQTLENYPKALIANCIEITKKYYLLKIKIAILLIIKPVLSKLNQANLNKRNADIEARELIINSFDKFTSKCFLIFETNQNLMKINLDSNIRYPDRFVNIFDKLNHNEKTFLLICKNYPYNILEKIPETDYYIELFNRDINKIYKISSFRSPYNPKKVINLTSVNKDYLNNYIFYLVSDDSYNIENISYISSKIIKILKQLLPINKMLFRNRTLDKKYIMEVYGYNEANNIVQKIDKIIQLI
jgi:dephospho-CoA kinase